MLRLKNRSKYIGSRSRALDASAAQWSVHVYKCVLWVLCLLLLFACVFLVSVVYLLQVIAVALNCVSQRFYIPKHSVPAQKYRGTLGAAKRTEKCARDTFAVFTILCYYALTCLYMHFQRNVLCLLLFVSFSFSRLTRKPLYFKG